MYKWDPAEYQDNSANQLKWGAELIAMLKLNGTERVLDIGCGVGNITAMLAEKLPRGYATGIDSSREMVAQAQNNYPVSTFLNLSFRVMDASSLIFDNEFDAVFSNATLHWVKDHKPVLKGITRALRPGGKVILQMGGKGNATGILATIDTLMSRPQWSQYFKNFAFPYGFYGIEEYRKWLKQAGLCETRVDLVPKDMTHENNTKLASWVRTTWLPYTQALPVELREPFIGELVTEYINTHPRDATGLFHVKMSRLEVEAYKP